MLKTYAVIRNVRVDDAAQVLTELLDEEGVTDFVFTLMSAVAEGYTFSVEAEETQRNVKLLEKLYGEANLTGSTEQNKKDARKRLEEKVKKKPAFDARGKEGRFAKEHRGER
jgi:hypothetical protein